MRLIKFLKKKKHNYKKLQLNIEFSLKFIMFTLIRILFYFTIIIELYNIMFSQSNT